jgi:hypothetical protein
MPLLALRVRDILKGFWCMLHLHEDCPYWYILGVISAWWG